MKPPAPPEVCAVKMTLRRLSREAREARKKWYAARDVDRQSDQPAAGAFVDLATIGMFTQAMWTAERTLAQCAERWREVLAAREAMPVAERWNLAALEKWAQAQVETL